MSSEKLESEVVDRRLFDADGNVRDDVAEEKDSTLEDVPELTLESLALDTSRAMEQVDITFNQIGTEMNQFIQQVQSTISDLHVRLGVLEELHLNADLVDDRAAIAAGTFSVDRFRSIAKEIVIPAIQERARVGQEAMKARFEAVQDLIKSGMTPEEAVAKIDGAPPVVEDPGIQIVSS